MHRRRFLELTAQAALLSGAGRLSAETAHGKFGLGFSLYGMKTLPLEEALTACAGIGYDNVELCLLKDFPTEPSRLSTEDRARLREKLKTAGLRVSALMENFSLLPSEAVRGEQLDRLKAAAELGHTLAPERPPVLETVLGGKPAEWEQVKDRMAETLRGWAATAEAADQVVAIKAHIMSAVQNPERIVWLMNQAASPRIQLTYDFSHFELQGLPLAATLDAMLPHTRFIHVKDGRMLDGGKVDFLLPGEGATDYGALFRALAERDYRGDVVVEVSRQISVRPGYEPVAAARQAFAALVGPWKAATGRP